MNHGKLPFAAAGTGLLLGLMAGCPTNMNGNGNTNDNMTEECPEWGYEAENGPAEWGALCADYAACGEGTEQSPVDLTGAVEGDLEGVAFDWAPTEFQVINNGETVRANVPTDTATPPTITVDGETYELVQFHFHMPSEHRLDGETFPMEVHFVHQTEGGTLAVVGLLIREGAENATLAELFANLPPARDDTYDPAAPIAIDGLLPAERATFRYAGSLTTPPCSEGLKWSVLEAPIELSVEQISAFDELYEFDNNRPIQPLGDREIVLVP